MFKEIFSLFYDVLVLNMFLFSFNLSHWGLRLQILLWSPGEGREGIQDILQEFLSSKFVNHSGYSRKTEK
jgi:hypothetical protein